MVPDIRWVDECGSTNTVLADESRASSETLPNAAFITDRQTAGKGRLGRSWESEPDTSLTMSLRFKMDTDSQILGLLPLAVGVAAHQCMVPIANADLGLRARIELKWPNDVMDAHTGRKLSGILCEAVPLSGTVGTVGTAVIAGIGVNVNRPRVLDGVFAERAQWLSELASPPSQSLDVVQLAADLITRIAAMVVELHQSPNLVAGRVRETCATVGRRVRVEQLTETWTGTATGIDDSGALIVRRDDTDSETRVHAADVVHLRAEDVS